MNDAQSEVGTPDIGSAGRKASGCISAGLRLLGASLVVLAFAFAYVAGMMPNALLGLLLVMAPATLLNRAWNSFHGRLEFRLVRQPLGRASRPYLLQGLNRCMFWAMVLLTLELCLVPIQFETDEFRTIRVINAALVAILVVCQAVPSRRVRLPGNVPYAVGWIFLASEWVRVMSFQAPMDAVVIEAPFRGEWYVFQGGRSSLINHHFLIRGQSHALDLVRVVDGREYADNPLRLESYASFGQPLLAPADGQVVRAVNDRPDVPIGESDTTHLVGNHVVIEVAKGRFVLMAHLQKGSVMVSEGGRVRRGQQVARCGNSGNTSEPHLHLQVQDRPDFRARDLRTYPIVFRDIERIRGGRYSKGTFGDLRRNDRIRQP